MYFSIPRGELVAGALPVFEKQKERDEGERRRERKEGGLGKLQSHLSGLPPLWPQHPT